MIKLDRKLNIVAKIDTEDGVLHIHSMPVGRTAFESNFELLAKAHAALNDGMDIRTSPAIARLTLKKIAVDSRRVNDYDAIINEIRRLTSVCVPGEGYDFIGIDEALKKGMIDEDIYSEVESYLVFFILLCWVEQREHRKKFTEMFCFLWGLATTSLNITEYCRSLTTSTAADNTGGSPTA